MSNIKLSLLVLRCQDLERSLTFYQNCGLVFSREKHGYGPVHFACELGCMVLELYPLKKYDRGQNRDQRLSKERLGFSVPSLDGIQDRMNEGGVEFQAAHDNQAHQLLLIDPDGRIVVLTESNK